MHIQEITEDYILFDNGNVITYDHNQDCCECNYADFMSLRDDYYIKAHNFNEELEFEFVDGFGFKFGSSDYWFAVPCYSEQNGYYTDYIDIYYNDVKIPHIRPRDDWGYGTDRYDKHTTKPVVSGYCAIRIE